MRWSSAAVALAGAKFVVALDPISVVGNKFFNKDGSQFFIKGMNALLMQWIYHIVLTHHVSRRCVPACP